MINVTKTFLPPQEEFNEILKRAWDVNWITNRGSLVKELENKLQDFLGVKHLLATTNGTLPLQIAIKALGLTGEIITTPFSYVATTSTIVWEGCRPVFVDIHPEYLTIDVSKIEAAITSQTSAIMATHVYGNPCNVEEISRIAKKYNLKVIYDAAHCFGVKYKNNSIFNYGDISTCSFHATKVFHTGEGGALICNSEALYKKLFYHHNFGHDGPEHYHGIGINAKMNELQAAMGLAVLPYTKEHFKERRKCYELYKRELELLPIEVLTIRKGTSWNYSYFPVICESENILIRIKNALEAKKVYPRRYFYPSLEELPYVQSNGCSVALKLSKRILCLPLSLDLEQEQILNITNLIKNVL